MAKAAAQAVFGHRDDDLVLKMAFGNVFTLDEAATEAVSALYGSKRGDSDGGGKLAEAPHSRHRGSVADYQNTLPDGLYPNYLVR